jgi:large subunit ribosomal protein L10
MPKQEKIVSIAAMKDRISRASALYFIDFTKVTANDFNALRRRLGVPVRVVKNRLALRALLESGTPADVATMLKGPTSVVFAGEDPVGPARVIREAGKKNAALRFKGAYLDRTLYGADRVEFIASLPTRPELHAQVVGVLEAPIAEFVYGIESLLSDLVAVLDQVKDRPAPAGVEAVPAAS